MNSFVVKKKKKPHRRPQHSTITVSGLFDFDLQVSEGVSLPGFSLDQGRAKMPLHDGCGQLSIRSNICNIE